MIGYEKPKTISIRTYTATEKQLITLVTRGKPSSVAKFCLSNPPYCVEILTALGNIIAGEVKQLCSDAVDSILRRKDLSSLKCFSWSEIIEEAKVHAPFMHNLLFNCSPDHQHKEYILGFIISLICSLQWKNINLPQRVISLILYAGHCSKQVY